MLEKRRWTAHLLDFWWRERRAEDAKWGMLGSIISAWSQITYIWLLNPQSNCCQPDWMPPELLYLKAIIKSYSIFYRYTEAQRDGQMDGWPEGQMDVCCKIESTNCWCAYCHSRKTNDPILLSYKVTVCYIASHISRLVFSWRSWDVLEREMGKKAEAFWFMKNIVV